MSFKQALAIDGFFSRYYKVKWIYWFRQWTWKYLMRHYSKEYYEEFWKEIWTDSLEEFKDCK